MGFQIELSYFFYKQFHANQWIEARYAFGQYTLALQKDKKQLTSIQIKFSRRTAAYSLLDHKGNEQTFEESKVEGVDEKLRRHKSQWLLHVTIMTNNRIPNVMLNKWTKTT